MNTRRWLNMMLSTAMAASLIIPSDALAHHGWAGYDATKTLTLTGSIAESSYTNPHGLIRLEVDGEGGKTWRVVLAPPARMKSRGLSEDMLRVGTTATAIGYPHRRD
jgi:hypothetical protein